MSAGRLYGVGLGPGDPELVTVKAVRVLESAPVVAFFSKTGRQGNARTIADRWIPSSARELPLHYPVTTEIPVSDPAYNEMLRAFYAEATEKLAAEGWKVVSPTPRETEPAGTLREEPPKPPNS